MDTREDKILIFRIAWILVTPIAALLLGSLLRRTRLCYYNSKGPTEKFRVAIVGIMAIIGFILEATQCVIYLCDGGPTEAFSMVLRPPEYLIVACSGIVQFLVQTHFLGTLHAMTHSKLLVVPIYALALISFLGACGRSITVAVSPDAIRADTKSTFIFKTSLLCYLAWLVAAVLVDVALAIALCYNLNKNSSTGFQRTETLLKRLIAGFMVTFSFNACVLTLTVAVFFIPKFGALASGIYGIGAFVFMTGLHIPSYYITLIYTLERRGKIAEDFRNTRQITGV